MTTPVTDAHPARWRTLALLATTLAACDGPLAPLARRARRLDRALTESLGPLALPALRILLGLLFVWFGALKLVGASPVEVGLFGKPTLVHHVLTLGSVPAIRAWATSA